jgi:hypothetical protein
MDDVSRHDIAHIESHIEQLVLSLERCRKVALAAKIAIGAGGAWIALSMFLLVPFVDFMMVAAAAAVIGGIVLLGSNATTWRETEALLRASEAMRGEMIGRLEMRVVDEDVKRVH